jgi:hypothetical protein
VVHAQRLRDLPVRHLRLQLLDAPGDLVALGRDGKKAFLRGNGHSAKELRGKKFGHKVCCLTERAAELGLTYMDEDKEIFSRMGSTDAMLRSRYIQTGFTNWPTPEGLERTCLSLRVAVATNLREKGLTIWL